MQVFLRPIVQVLFFLIFFTSCVNNQAKKNIYLASKHDKRDATTQWLSENEHFLNNDYYTKFFTYYTKKIQQKDLPSAATALQSVTEREMYYLSFNEKLTSTVSDFDTLHSLNLPWHKTLFIDAYFANIFMDKGEYRAAIEMLRPNTSYQPFDFESCLELGNLMSDLGFCYAAIGDHVNAINTNTIALRYFTKINHFTGIGGVHDNTALVHMFSKNYAEAEVYFNKATEAYKKANDSINLFTPLHNKILMYQETNHPNLYALIDSTYHLFINSKIQDPSFYIAFGSLYVDKLLINNEIKEAEQLLIALKKELDKVNSAVALDDYTIALANFEIKTKRKITDIEQLKKAFEIVEINDHFQNQIAFSEVLKEAAILEGDYESALMYAEKMNAAMNNLSNREIIMKTLELNKKYQTKSKEQQISLQNESILNKNFTIALLITSIIIIVLIVIILLNRQKQKQIKSEREKAILYTRQLLEKTEEERRRIAGDLHDSVSHELLNLKNSAPFKDPQYNHKIDEIINDIRIISRNLHPIMFEKVGLEASIQQLVERTQTIHHLMVTADIEYDGYLSVSDELQVYRIIQEALSNVIKYADAVAAKIILLSQQDQLYIRIIDNGNGFNVQKKLSDNSSFGLLNIIERSKAIGGLAKIHSDKKGTKITVEIKK